MTAMKSQRLYSHVHNSVSIDMNASYRYYNTRQRQSLDIFCGNTYIIILSGSIIVVFPCALYYSSCTLSSVDQFTSIIGIPIVQLHFLHQQPKNIHSILVLISCASAYVE